MVRTYGILVKKLKEERGSRRSGCRSHSRLMDEGQCIPYNSNLVISAPSSSSTLSFKQDSVSQSTLSHVFPFCLANLSVK